MYGSSTTRMYNVQCAMYNVQCTMYDVQCTMHGVHCTLCVCTLNTVHVTHCTARTCPLKHVVRCMYTVQGLYVHLVYSYNNNVGVCHTMAWRRHFVCRKPSTKKSANESSKVRKFESSKVRKAKFEFAFDRSFVR